MENPDSAIDLLFLQGGSGVRRAALVLFIFLSAHVASADNTRTEGGDWGDSAKWSEGTPTASESVLILGASVMLNQPIGAARILTINGGLSVEGDPLTIGLVGRLSVGTELFVGYDGMGEMNVSTGGQVFTGNTVVSARGDGTAGTVTIDGTPSPGPDPKRASWFNQGDFIVGTGIAGSSTAVLNLVNGATLTTGRDPSSPINSLTSIGAGIATGTATVDNSTWTNNEGLTVGAGGRGTLNIIHGGTVSDRAAAIGRAGIVGARGTVTMDGGTWTHSLSLDVGEDGPGTLLLLHGSTITDTVGTLGAMMTGDGTATLDNSSHWTNSSSLVVGDSGQGKLTIESGSVVTGAYAALGLRENAAGIVTVDHGILAVAGEMDVAFGLAAPPVNSSGLLTIQNGGVVVNANATVGNTQGSHGSVSVNGISAESTRSTWNCDTLVIGGRGTAMLDVFNGGIVRSHTMTIAFEGAGTVRLTGTSSARGTLESGQISTGIGVGFLIIDGGVLRATADTPAFLSHFTNSDLAINGDGVTIDSYNHNIGIPVPLQGTGGLTKVGAGTLDLTGIDHYQGVTTVNAGKLLVNGTLTGEVVVNAGGTLGGNGSTGKVTVNPGGILSPGNSPGMLTINGDYLQSGAGILNMELGGTNPGVDYDQLVVTGTATLGGVLNLTLVNGFQPSVGDTFNIFNCSSISGSFARIVSSGFSVSQSQSGGGILLTVTSVQPNVPAITSPLVLNVTPGNPFVYQVTATGAPSAYNAADLPAGLAIDPATGIISGTPGASGSSAIVLSAANGAGTGSAVLSLTVGPAANAVTNMSTRLRVGTGDNVAIAGFIVAGSEAKAVVIRALGPTLSQFGVNGTLQNPTLELRDGSGALITTNDNWADAADTTAVSAAQLAPPKPSEAAISASLAPGNYTAIASGVNSTTGVALVEVYDVSPEANSRLSNISTRGLVQSGNNVMIAGVIVQGRSQTVLIRGLGPTLTQFGVPNALQDPNLDLRDANGNQLAANDNWKDTQQAVIQASGFMPPDDRESAIFTTLAPGNYTAILSGTGQTTGNALVEVYTLN